MKNLLYIFLFFFSVNVFAQNSLPPLMKNYWKKVEITTKDGSKIYNEAFQNALFDIKIISEDSLWLFSENRAVKYAYKYKDSLLVFKQMVLKLKALSETQMILDQANEDDPIKAIKLIFEPKNLHDLTYSPESYIANKGEQVYKVVFGKLEPHFNDINRTPMNFIFEKFGFPEYKKAGFVVRFVITKTGALKGIKVLASSNDRYNQKLIDAVKKTEGKWIPGEFRGEKVNIEVEYDFNLGYTEQPADAGVDSLAYSVTYYDYGNELFERGSYRQAERYYQKAIDYNPLNVNAYYQHAAANIFLRKKEEACKDYEQLIFLEQKKAKTLYEKYCK
ncbi:MAG: hypothetical protein IPP61_03780 [Cytophagaceae bacterium]|nr:hypothetical protein [Cytophagaceae bacterium]MBL0301473.1 hypothetical protein [Cytophagaceae bacterium]MBL0324294.1 hypothetical protein [Cytophagaceae bacterium]